jgi:hypothetical protein
MAAAAVRREWGQEPLYVREGGTMPVASVLEKLLGAPAILLPLGQVWQGRWGVAMRAAVGVRVRSLWVSFQGGRLGRLGKEDVDSTL